MGTRKRSALKTLGRHIKIRSFHHISVIKTIIKDSKNNKYGARLWGKGNCTTLFTGIYTSTTIMITIMGVLKKTKSRYSI